MKQSKKEAIARRRSLACGALDRETVCRGVMLCGRCNLCLIHCECTTDAHVEPGAETLAGEQLGLCARPRLEWL